MKSVNIHEAKTNFSKLLKRVASGEEIVIAKAGKPIAKLVRFEPSKQRRNLGTERGKFAVPADFNDALPESLETRLGSLAARGMITLPTERPRKRVRRMPIKGKSVSRALLKDRR